MSNSPLSRIVNANCYTRSLTIRYLSGRLDRLNTRIRQADAKMHHYLQRDRVEKQLREARSYLC